MNEVMGMLADSAGVFFDLESLKGFIITYVIRAVEVIYLFGLTVIMKW